MTAAQSHSAKDVERVGLKLFEILEREIGEGREVIRTESLMAQAIREAKIR